MESRDIEICKEIGQLIYDAAPVGSTRIVMRAELAEEGDHAKFEFDAIDSKGNVSWFTGGGVLNRSLLGLLVRHRDFFVSQNQPAWKVFSYTLDVEKGKFSLQLSYD
ncbi:hypothetical protein [Ralstonia solanacearum]|uniref:hypothetical protein n=1 Tax=Ralstonia solanacearum TaxID=305 RepID=UPI001FFBD7FC